MRWPRRRWYVRCSIGGRAILLESRYWTRHRALKAKWSLEAVTRLAGVRASVEVECDG